MFQLGPRDDRRFAAVEPDEREYLTFLVDFTAGILQRRPNHIEALRSAAESLTALGYYQAGLSCDRRLAACLPDDATVVYNLACSLSLVGETDEAIRTLARAVDLGYADVRHMRRDPDLANLRELPAFVQLEEQARSKTRRCS